MNLQDIRGQVKPCQLRQIVAVVQRWLTAAREAGKPVPPPSYRAMPHAG